MDPQKTNTLDPKLKETYDRVMGTKFNSETVKPTQPAIPQPAKPPPQSIQPTANQPTAPNVTAPPPPLTKPLKFEVENITVPSSYRSSSTFIADEEKKSQNNGKSSKISPLVLILVIISFFVVYALFWVKFFNLESLPVNLPISISSIPFLSQ